MQAHTVLTQAHPVLTQEHTVLTQAHTVRKAVIGIENIRRCSRSLECRPNLLCQITYLFVLLFLIC